MATVAIIAANCAIDQSARSRIGKYRFDYVLVGSDDEIEEDDLVLCKEDHGQPTPYRVFNVSSAQGAIVGRVQSFIAEV